MQSRKLTTGWEHHRGTLGGIWEVWRGDKLKNHYNVPWSGVELPHCYNAKDAVDPDRIYYQGPGWYRTRLKVDNPYPGGRTLLYFEGAGQKTDLYIFNMKAGSHTGGYDRFWFDITDTLQELEGSNFISHYFKDQVPICVRCDNSRDLEMIPSDISDFNLYGGIYRPVHLVYLPKISLDAVHIETQNVSHSQAEVSVQARLYNPKMVKTPLAVEITIRDPEGNPLHNFEFEKPPWPEEQKLVEFTVETPELWSPDTPALYECRVKITGTHSQTALKENFGLRFFEFEPGGPFRLNGKRLLLKGTHRHEDHAGVGAAVPEETTDSEMRMIKKMGANFIRLGHYQQSEQVLNLCDQLGLLVWEEIPWCRGGLGGERYRNQARSMLRAMIDQHKNHPSVIIWGLGNENDWEADFPVFDEEEIRDFMSELNEIAHQKDPDRLTGIRRCDFCRDIVDVYSPSIWSGWYGGVYPDYEETLTGEFAQVERALHMEWGADNLQGRHVEQPFNGLETDIEVQNAAEQDGDFFLSGGRPRIAKDGDWSETYFCNLCDWYLKTQRKLDSFSGSAQWVFKDFSTPVRPENPVPYMNLKGVVTRDLKKKEAYYLFQAHWSSEPMVHIYAPEGAVRWGDKGEEKTVKVYSSCPSVELFLDGESLGKKQRNPDDFPSLGLRWRVQFEDGNNSLKAVGTKNGATVEDQAEILYQTASWEKPAKLRLEKKQRSAGRIYIEVRAFDQKGIFCPDADFFVQFDLAGNGKLIDNLGTPDGSRKVQLATGRAGIWVEAKRGRSVVSASAAGLETALLELP